MRQCWMRVVGLALVLGVALGVSARGQAPPGAQAPPRPEFPPFEEVAKDFEKVVSTADGAQSLYTIYVRKKDQQMLAELPRDFESKRYFIALTVASGETYAGLQAGEQYVYWKRYDKRLALIEPNVATRSTGDQESKDSVQRLFTDRVILDVPILTIPPNRGPVIDMRGLLVGHASRFFGGRVQVSNPNLVTIRKAKAFPFNVELAFEAPTSGGRLQTLHYSISVIPDNTGYTPREADERIGYFTTGYQDLGKFKEGKTRVRYINRWHLEKADPSLKTSPPKNPIVFYIEHTTPIRYRRWVREGILYWNKAFEKVGLSNAVEVYYQDAPSKAHIDKDPEDVRYNFVRWLNNNQGTAIGPSRVHPLTGQILDADIILTDGWIRHYWRQFHEVMPKLAMEGMSPETLAWLTSRPNWDPRVLLAPPAQREHIAAQLAGRSLQPFGGHPMTHVDPGLIGDDEFDGLIGRTSQVNGMCMAADYLALDLGLYRMMQALVDAPDAQAADPKKEPKKDQAKKDEPKKDENLLDGMPEQFIGPLLAELVAHEVGHTLGLRHNFKASSVYSLQEINSDKVKGKQPFAASVMDYLPINMTLDCQAPGDHTMLGIGPYDFWAIEYGYTFEKDLKPILSRVAEPELPYATDEDTWGPDPLARRYDFSKNPLDYAKDQLATARLHRTRLIDKFVKEGESWSKARRGYEMTLMMQTRAISMMANWLGGAFVHRDKKGDKNGRAPIEVVPTAAQREALRFVIDHTFKDDAFGISAELLSRMTTDRWFDSEDGIHSLLSEDPDWPIHDRIMGIQSSTLTMLMNPTTLRRVYDNEFRIPAGQDALTLPELIDALSTAVWAELKAKADKQYTARTPLISSLRRNLQRQHLERLIDLTLPGAGDTAAYKPVMTLAMAELRRIKEEIARQLKESGGKLDPYSRAHLAEAEQQIARALDAQYIYNAKDMGGGSSRILFLLNDQPAQLPK